MESRHPFLLKLNLAGKIGRQKKRHLKIGKCGFLHRFIEILGNGSKIKTNFVMDCFQRYILKWTF